MGERLLFKRYGVTGSSTPLSRQKIRDFAISVLKNVAIQVMPPLTLARMKREYEARVRPRKWSEVEEDILHMLVPRNRTAFDVGANIGSYTEQLALLAPRVVAFEPDLDTAQHILSRRFPNVEVVTKAVSDRNGTGRLLVPVAGAKRMSALATLEVQDETAGKYEANKVETITLDDYASSNVGFVKIDVEGHEHKVLQGASRLIENQRPVFLIEMEDRHRPGAIWEMKHFFDRFNYIGYFIFNGKTYDLSALTAHMTDPSELTRSVPRKKMRYVNNFIFEPDPDIATTRRARIERALPM